MLVSLGGIQTFQIQRSRSNGFRDIVVEMHGSATQRTLRLLRFGNGKYHEGGCYDANSLDAYTRLLRHLPADMGVAIVIVNHLRTVATLLHEILPRYTEMPVELITERLLIQPNRVFMIPEQRDLHVLDGEFRLKPISKPRGWPDVITVFLRSLTQHWDGKLIAVIVSGYDGDGAAALCGIKEVGGITIAQKLDTAGQPDMPESAIASGCVDFVLSPEDIAQEIVRICGRTIESPQCPSGKPV